MYRESRIKLIGECLQVEIKDEKYPEHFCLGFSTDDPYNAEGHHAQEMLVIFDEAKGIEPWMWDSLKGAMTGGHCRWLAISTTDGVEIGSPYYNCFQDGSDWNQICITAYDCPPVTGEEYEGIEVPDTSDLSRFHRKKIHPDRARIQIASKEYIEESLDPVNGWGEGSVLFKTKVMAEIVTMTSGAIIQLPWVRKMFENWSDPGYDRTGKKRCGVDPAWGGANDTVAWKAT